MHDLNYFREHLADFEKMAAQRSVSIDFEGFRGLDRERREKITTAERQKADLAYWKKMIDYTGIKVE